MEKEQTVDSATRLSAYRALIINEREIRFKETELGIEFYDALVRHIDTLSTLRENVNSLRMASPRITAKISYIEQILGRNIGFGYAPIVKCYQIVTVALAEVFGIFADVANTDRDTDLAMAIMEPLRNFTLTKSILFSPTEE